jgi:hypothetical protein
MYARISAFLAAFALAISGLAAAQETTGSLAGQVVDPQGLAVPGATVTVTGPQGARTLVTDADGRYVAPFLTPGLYAIRVELQGFKAAEQKDIAVSLAQRREVNVKLETGGLTETVQVSATSPVIDVRSTTVGGVLDSEQLSRLPVGRSLAAMLYIVPGVSDSSGAGAATPSIGGASGLENSYVIDGVNITDVGFGGMGSYNSQYGSLGAGVTSDFIKETQVMTAGFEAEFGDATGGVVNVVTKSGSNAFSGSLFGYARPAATEAGWRELTTPNGTVNTEGTSNSDYGISLGGRIVPDRVFFFGTYNGQYQTRTFLAPNNTAPVFSYASLGGIDRKRTIHAYAGKVTSQIKSGQRIDVSIFGDPSSGDGLQRFSEVRRVAYPGAPGTRDIRGGFSELNYGTHNQAVRYDGVFGSRWLLEANLANSNQKFDETPATDEWLYADLRTLTGSDCGLPAGQVCPQGRTGGLGFFEQNDGQNLQYGIKSTHILSGGGTHEIRYGVQMENIDFTRGTDYSGPNLRLADGRTTVTGGPLQIRTGGGVTFYRSTRGLLVTPGPTTQDYTNFFIQDSWQTGRLTIRPGIRYERQYLEGQDPSAFPAPLCHEGDSRPGVGDGSGPGIACNFTWENWAPRIGGTFDLTGDGRAKVFASWGHFFAKIPNDLAARAMSADTGITRQNYVDAGLTQPVANGVNFAGSTAHLLLTSDHAATIDPNSGSTYKNEFLAGVEFDVLGNANLGFRYIRRTMPQILEDIGQLAIAGYILAPDTPVDYFITNVNANTPVVPCCGVTYGFEDPQHTYDSFEVTLNKRFSGNWSSIASYRYSRLKGNFEGFFRSDNGQSDPAISSLFDFPTDDPSYVALADEHGGSGDIRFQGCTLGCGTLPNDRPHQLKLYGNYLWNRVNIGAGFNAGSGHSLTAMASNPIYANAGEIPETLRGEGMQTVDGFRERSPIEVTLDLHVDYGFEFGGRRLMLLADAFNVFNRDAATWYDYFSETTVGVANPNFGQPVNGGSSSITSFQAPFALRFGARLDW